MVNEHSTETELKEEIKKLQAQIAENEAQREYLERLHKLDYLTGLHNRGAFDKELALLLELVRGEHEEHRSKGSEPKMIALLFIDLDHFKQVNDIYGHLFGDVVLKKVSALFEKMVREDDFVARIGGEEFAFLLRDVDTDVAVLVAEKYRKAVEALVFDDVGVASFKITASFGVATSLDAQTPQALYSCADTALYEAKESGRNRTVLYKKQGTS